MSLANLKVAFTNLVNRINTKANSQDVYSKTQSDNRYYTKSNTYTKTEVDNLLSNAASNIDLSSKADITYVNSQIATRAKKPFITYTTPIAFDYQDGDIIFYVE